MRYWLVKSEPEEWSWDDQVAKGAAGEGWTGVRNHQAAGNLKAMQKGDRAFLHFDSQPTNRAGQNGVFDCAAVLSDAAHASGGPAPPARNPRAQPQARQTRHTLLPRFRCKGPPNR